MGFLHSTFVLLVLYFMLLSDAQLLPAQEVQTLTMISLKLNNKHWKTLDRRSCNRPDDFNRTFPPLVDIYSNVSCDCSFSRKSVCHVTHIEMKGLNLTGELPAEFSNLTNLLVIDLSRNYINGSIPSAFGQMHLTNLSLVGNRIRGSIPPEIGNIDTLEELVLENNQLEGPLPAQLGSMIRLKRLLLSGNNFSGKIPETYGNLKNLTDFRVDGNGLSGKIPEFIGKWTNITRLDLQGTGMSGPIPLAISLLNNLEYLRISDLSGTNSSTIPDLKDMKSIKTLTLRNCLMSGEIPEYIGKLITLKSLDLSFNKLTGPIKDALEPLHSKMNFLYLNNNSLTGAVPKWISNSNDNYDASYNNFTQTPGYNCQTSRVNLISSHSSTTDNSGLDWCLKKDLPCSRKPRYHSLFINCGGNKTQWERNEYEEDTNEEGASYFYSDSSEKWAYSSAGEFVGRKGADYLAINDNITEEIYRTARLAPSSLRYYGLCLQKGSYKVRLHFAEIQYSGDNTFSSIGRRIFDVSIQGHLRKKNFNIAEDAKGFGLPTTLEYNVEVDDGTLEIHLYWAGKGTNAIPDKGVYGPLISAITVTPNFKVDTGRLSTGAIAGIVVCSISGVILILLLLWRKGFLGGKDIEDKELRGAIELQTGYFSLRHIKAATNNFDPANKIGEGGFGPVYKGVLSDNAVIAVKQLSSKSKQGNREFINEIGMISALQHPNLVKLFGCCIEGNQLLLVYEYLENNSLARALFGHEEQKLNLDWPTRKKIFLQIARGLAYLHEESRLKIVHRDIKATNVLLDKDLNAKISDFGLAKLDEEENTHISTRIAGTIGYMAPEYAMRGYLTDKADVYSFGIVALEIVSGKSNTNYRPKQEFVYLLDWAYVLQEQGKLLDLVDPILGSNYSKEEALRMLNMALLCTNQSFSLRPSMSTIVSMTEGKTKVEAPMRTESEDDMRFKAFEKGAHDSQSHSYTFSQESRERSISVDGPWADSSVSFQSKDASTSKLLPDLYDVNID
ncbi:probable LRR receptor-like serine/threonine-protein kinase At1g53430 isoform X1 [Daucus carota subsp. sativus]|uniref:probable LRR receptor-like serine/threonine-protein kinase At1g53430 isoform X1 n=2 Tax=Daucus carota subsp. sativus TaxID=79200 RepID=UPI0007F049B2|nr:PREDICTED: probable LRR receptor-like serine/threonine-protein kinase At1g53430 [Daucus carota subsp. sativus]